MKLTATRIPEVILIEPEVFRDRRGFFLETYHQAKFARGGITARFVQDNHSRSERGVLRGLHAQAANPQGKLVRAIEGGVFDVAVDVRRGSPTFGRWVGEYLSADNFRQLWIPEGFLHGFFVLSRHAQVEYKCTALYDPGDQLDVAWNDPQLAIAWPSPEPLLSDKDKNAPTLAEVMDRLPRYR
ncbi:MAG: dTDP-4-dehydrorhamnose 3,5-epimerase [Acidobacteria bacterium]|nr:MAG: dTDP-4-dehydrorhamnose 3,5-epimerase [Acidobacteriota bacterium]